jgi:LysR family transcriptional regulator, regulator of gene expression of beta-lactamase
MAKSHLPLNALRAFEASARHLSFTKAGMELRVGQAAISHRSRASRRVSAFSCFAGCPAGWH